MGSPHHDEETIELALTMLALAGDSTTKAVVMMRDAGVRVSRKAITDWREKYADRYADIRDVRAREIERTVVHKTRSLIDAYSDAERELLEIVLAQARAGTLKDPSTAARNAAVGKGIAADKMLTLSGRPNQISEHRSPTTCFERSPPGATSTAKR